MYRRWHSVILCNFEPEMMEQFTSQELRSTRRMYCTGASSSPRTTTGGSSPRRTSSSPRPCTSFSASPCWKPHRPDATHSLPTASFTRYLTKNIEWNRMELRKIWHDGRFSAKASDSSSAVAVPVTVPAAELLIGQHCPSS